MSEGHSKKKNKNKNVNGAEKKEEDNNPDQASGTMSIGAQELLKIKKAMESMQLSKGSKDTPLNEKQFEFWSTQPVPKLDEVSSANEPIVEDIPVSDLRKQPFSLPSGFHWDTLKIDDPIVLKELYVLLNENYVEDDDNLFRFDYSPEFLRWALQPPGYLQEWHTGVRITKSNKLVGFISAVPANIRVHDALKKMVEINFLCVHKKLRSKRLAPVLIKEITRRVNCQGIFQAVYTAGVVLPTPVGTCRYWHRSLNPKKLIEVQFSHLSRNMTMQRQIKLLKLPENTKIEGLRALTAADVPGACKLLNEYLSNYKMVPEYTDEEFGYWFLPRDNIINTYVVEKSNVITDMISFYTLPSTVVNHPTHKNIKAAYSFYNVAKSQDWTDLMSDALVLAKKLDFDVFNALDLMENTEFLERLKFGIGDGNLQYYLYNWRCPTLNSKEIGLVLQ